MPRRSRRLSVHTSDRGNSERRASSHGRSCDALKSTARLTMCVLVSLAVVSHAAAAQRTTGWLDIGGATVRQSGSDDLGAATVGAGIMQRGRRFLLIGDGALTLAADSLAATQAVVRGLFALTSWTVSEIETSATSIGIAVPGKRGNRSVLFRQQLQLGRVRLFGSAGFGNTSRHGLDSHSGTQQLGVSATRGEFTLTTTAQRATTDDWQLMEAAGFSLRSNSEWYGMHDATAELLWQFDGFALSASRTWRAGFGVTRGTGRAYSYASSLPFRRRFTLIANSGCQLADPLRGTPQATYMGLAMRVQFGRASGARDAAVRDAARRRVGGMGSAAQLTVFEPIDGAEYRLEQRDGGAELGLRVNAPRDAIVEVAHSANEWTPMRLTRDGDAFVARITLASGTHRVALRINRGEWREPRGLSRVADDFGGNAGLVVVP